jgi:nucleotide-binding universal stress UspA family protein
MARGEVFLVPVDFSRGSEKALDYALKMARQQGAKVVSLHVVPTDVIYPQTGTRFDLYGLMAGDARRNFQKLVKRKHLDPKNSTLMLAHGTDLSAIIARHAKKISAAMIVMGSHGRTGLRRFLLGSVAERTLRYADCPVLIVK